MTLQHTSVKISQRAMTYNLKVLVRILFVCSLSISHRVSRICQETKKERKLELLSLFLILLQNGWPFGHSLKIKVLGGHAVNICSKCL